MFNTYYQNELSFLRQLGKEFGEMHPEAAHLIEEFGGDPDVERLLEGVAFLTAGIRQRIEDEIPDVTHTLLQVLWPHYLRPVPSMAMLQFRPIPGNLQRPLRIDPGVEVDSEPVEGTKVRFRTCYPVELLPLELEELALEQQSAKTSQLRLSFSILTGESIAQVGFNRIRLHFSDSRQVATTLYYWLLERCTRVDIVDPESGQVEPLPRRCLSGVGFDAEGGLLPYPPTSFRGYRLIQEYFSLPEAYLSVDVSGLQGFDIGPRFDLVFRFDGHPPVDSRPKLSSVRLHCTPIINLFGGAVDPVRRSWRKAEYRLRVNGPARAHYELFSVDSVIGIRRGSATRRSYRSLVESHREAKQDQVQRDEALYRLHIRPSVARESADTFISFTGSDVPPRKSDSYIGAINGSAVNDYSEIVSIDVTATHGSLPESLSVGSIRVPTQRSPNACTFTNLTRPTPFVMPPLGPGLIWSLIAHLTLNNQSIGSAQNLRTLLRLYQFPARRDQRRTVRYRRLVEGIEAVRTVADESLYRGSILRGQLLILEVRESNFQGVGDLYLFGTVLSHFLGLYCTLNSFIRLEINGQERGLTLSWPARMGRQCLA